MKGVPISKVSAIISKEWERVMVSSKKMKKYRGLYEKEKRRHEEALQRYQEDHVDEMEIINLHKRWNNTDVKAATKTGAEAAKKTPRSRYHLFLREHLDEMTGENQKKLSQYCVKKVEGDQRRSCKTICMQ